MMTAPPRVFIGLGANLGDAAATLATALDALRALPGTRLVAQYSVTTRTTYTRVDVTQLRIAPPGQP